MRQEPSSLIPCETGSGYAAVRPAKRKRWHCYCSYCGGNIKEYSIVTDARLDGTFHQSCLFKAMKAENKYYQKPRIA